MRRAPVAKRDEAECAAEEVARRLRASAFVYWQDGCAEALQEEAGGVRTVVLMLSKKKRMASQRVLTA